MSDSKPSPNVDYPRLLICRKCGGQVDEVGWCANCARRRRNTSIALLALAIPALGLGVCVSMVPSTSLSSIVFASGGCFAVLAVPVFLIIFLTERGKDPRP